MIYVLDASAMIAWLRNEPGADVVDDAIRDLGSQCLAHAINLCKVYSSVTVDWISISKTQFLMADSLEFDYDPQRSTTWRWAFNLFPSNEFTKESLTQAIREEIIRRNAVANMPSETTLKRDVDIFLRTITVAPRFTRSINLERDATTPEAIDGDIVTTIGQDFLGRLMLSLTAPAGHRAWTITGTYGSGKSALALYIANLLGPASTEGAESHALSLGSSSRNFTTLFSVGGQRRA